MIIGVQFISGLMLGIEFPKNGMVIDLFILRFVLYYGPIPTEEK